MTQFMTANSFLGLGIENSRGIAAASPTFIPITSPQVTPMQVFLRDEALRGSPTTVYDQVAGVRHDEYDVKGYVYADSFPILLRSILGGGDTVTGSSPYAHNIKLLNNNTNGSQPPSVTIQDFDGATAFQMTGAQMSELSLTFGAEAAAEWSAKFMGNPYTQIATPSASFSTASFVPGWDISTSIAGTSVAYVAEGEIRLNRNTAPIFTMGTQAPRVSFAGPLEVSGRLLCVVETTSDIFSNATNGYALNRSPQPLVVTMTDPVSSNTVAFTMTKVQYQDVKRQRGKSFVEVEVNFTANANSTDAASGSGYSPISTITTNNVSTAYTGS
jgi:hypothetical protein